MTAILNIDDSHVRSYKTLENLEAAIKKNHLDKFRYLVVCNSAGRFTAVFTVGELERNGISYLGYFCQYGFLTIG